MVPSIGTVSSESRMASTAAWSDLWPSPCPIVWAHAIAACSTTRRKSSDKSEFIDSPSTRGARRRSSLIGRQLAARRLVLAVAEDVVGLHDLVDFARPLVDPPPPPVAVQPAR